MINSSPNRGSIVRAPGPPSFELHSLGWRAFQDLAGTVLREVLGQSFQTFADGRDAGRDGAFYGTWNAATAASGFEAILAGPCVVQCKHVARGDATLSPSQMEDEFEKIPALVARGLCTSYILMTNARVTGISDSNIRARLVQAGVMHALVLNGSWVNQTIASNPKLRMLVPRVYGLGDLSQILDERAYSQARELLSYLHDDLSTFVITDAYRRSVEALRAHRFLLLLGEPAVGKSLIAAALAMSALDSWGCETIRVDTPGELIEHWNPNEPNQFFWVDDAFGAIRHDRALSDEWTRRLPRVMAAISAGARVVMTSREYIYREARPFLKEYAFPLLSEQQVVVDVTTLTPEEKRRILYNHVKGGDQSSEVRAAMKPHLPFVAEVTPFRPEVARRLGHRAFTQGVPLTRAGLETFAARPTQFLRDIFEQLDVGNVAALAYVYMVGVVNFPFEAGDKAQLVADRLGVTTSDVGTSLAFLEGSFLRRAVIPGIRGSEGWSFHHPTLREGFASFIATHPTLTGMLLEGLSDESLLQQIDCGSGETRGELIDVPLALYRQVAERVASLRPARKYGELYSQYTTWMQFLNRRSGREFLEIYLDVDPNLVPTLLNFTSFLDVVLEPELLARLMEFGLLGEGERQQAIDRVRKLAIETPDSAWLDRKEWLVLMKNDERNALLDAVRNELLPNLEDQVEDWRSNYETQEDPASYFYPLETSLKGYRRHLGDDQQAAAALDAALGEVQAAAESAYDSYQDDAPEPPGRDSLVHLREEPTRTGTATRDIFDDVDE